MHTFGCDEEIKRMHPNQSIDSDDYSCPYSVGEELSRENEGSKEEQDDNLSKKLQKLDRTFYTNCNRGSRPSIIGSSFIEMKRVLIVDDSSYNLFVMQELLQTIPAIQIIKTAMNGQECLDLLKENKSQVFDVIFLDIHMPIMDGIQTIKILREW